MHLTSFYLVAKANVPVTSTSILSTLQPPEDLHYLDRNSSSETDNDESESNHLQSSYSINSFSSSYLKSNFYFQDEIKIPNGGVPLTPDQASILTTFLYEYHHDEEQLHRVLRSIANASIFKES